MGNPLAKYLSNYVPAKLVLLFDEFVSVFASLLVFVVVYLFVPQANINANFTWQYLAFSALYSFASFSIFSTYTLIVRHTDFKDSFRFFCAALFKVILLAVTWMVVGKLRPLSFLILVPDFILTLVLLLLSRFLVVLFYDIYRHKHRQWNTCKRLLIYGISNKSLAAVGRFKDSSKYDIVGFLVPRKHTQYKLSGFQIYEYEGQEDLKKYIRDLGLQGVLFASESEAANESQGLIHQATELGLSVLIVPAVEEHSSKLLVREIKIEDLLERPQIQLSVDKVENEFQGKTILVTGAAGSIGSQLCRLIATFGVKKLLLFDNAETPIHNLRLELSERFPELDFTPIIGDIRQLARLDYVFRTWRPQIVFHAAAYKHVPLMEENPCEAVLSNLCGTRNVADKCVEYAVEKMVMISSDKAVNPTNVMGCSKRLAEIYVQSLGLSLQSSAEPLSKTRFVTTRFGNVLGSNGSVIPRFREQIKAGGPVTVTHPEITRYFMTIPEACLLVIEAVCLSNGNDIFAFDMGSSVKIDHLARRMIELSGYIPDKEIKIVYTGLRPGEKLYEEVLSDEENTLPTQHERIRIAKVRDYSFAQALEYVNRLEELASQVDIPALVRLMKEIVPEYVSNNSDFEIYDKKN